MKNLKKIKHILVIFSILFAALSIADIVYARAGRSSSSSSRSYSKSGSSSYSSKSYSSKSYSGKNYSSYNKSSSYGSSNYSSYKNSSYPTSRSYNHSGGYGSYPYSEPLIRRSFFGFTRESSGGSYPARSSYNSSYGSSNYSGDGSFGVEGWIGLIFLVIMFRLFIAFISWLFRMIKYIFSAIFSLGSGAGVYKGSSASMPDGCLNSFAGTGGDIRNEDIELRVREVFFKVQKAWAERDQRIASDCMSPRLYEKHKFDTDEMIANNEINILENLKLLEVRIIELTDGPAIGESSRGAEDCGRMSAYIRASVIDYIINASTRSHIEGDREAPEEFVEIWKFLKGPEDWIVDEIIVKE